MAFADYVRDLMEAVPKVNGNPMMSVTSMTDENARYREDPFYRSRDIQARDQLVLDEEERRRREAALSGSGMMTGGGEGGGGNIPLTPEQKAYFDLKTQAEKDAHMGQLQRMMVPGVIQGLMGMGAPVLSNLPNYNIRSEELQREQARQYVAPQAAQAILAREAENRAMSEISRNYGGFRDNGTYVTSYGPVVSTSGMSSETRSGLEAAQASFGYGTNADYYGD